MRVTPRPPARSIGFSIAGNEIRPLSSAARSSMPSAKNRYVGMPNIQPAAGFGKAILGAQRCDGSRIGQREHRRRQIRLHARQELRSRQIARHEHVGPYARRRSSGVRPQLPGQRLQKRTAETEGNSVTAPATAPVPNPPHTLRPRALRRSATRDTARRNPWQETATARTAPHTAGKRTNPAEDVPRVNCPATGQARTSVQPAHEKIRMEIRAGEGERRHRDPAGAEAPAHA